MDVIKVHIACLDCTDDNGLAVSKDVFLKPYPGNLWKCPDCGQEYRVYYDEDKFAVTVQVKQ
jgi:hypothetical protein